jgi:hypothetical protein
MKRILIVSPHWSPINAADLQRVRMGLRHYRDNGWEPTVLAIAPEFIEGGVLEPLLEESYPRDIRVIRTGGLRPSVTRRFGVGSLWLRCGAALRRAGDELLARERFDLAFFSTTQFSAFSLGPRWRRRHRLPYVLDYQDPWRNDYYARTRTRPPGGQLKFFLSQLEARRREPVALRHAAGVIAVSDSYGQLLHRLYPWFPAEAVRVLPFGCSEHDFVLARGHAPAAPLIDFHDGHIHLVYVGRCGPDMQVTLRALFEAFALHTRAAPAQAARVRFHFIGTGYAPPPLGREWVLPIARELGLQQSVSEHCYRVPYFDALHYLAQAHALLAVGSNDASYSPSKIYPNLMAQRPLLMIYHEKSLVCDVARDVGGAVLTTFHENTVSAELARDIHARWFANEAYLRASVPNAERLRPYGAAAATAKLCAFFDEVAR